MPSCLNHAEVMEGLNRCTRCGKTFCGDCLVELKSGFFCATCKVEQVKDIQSGLESGAEFRYAGFWIRLGAYIVDSIFVSIITIPFAVATGSFGAQPKFDPDGGFEMPPHFWITQVFSIAATICYWGFMTQHKGQTLGKMAMKIKVVNAEGGPITPGQAWGRTLAQIIGGTLLLATYFPIPFTREKTGIHDLLARTRVIRLRQ